MLTIVESHRRGIVLDLGCSDREPASVLSQGRFYIGLDYLRTTRECYQTRRDVFGDAQRLPNATGAVHTVLLLEVLEHLSHPDDCLEEIVRVLKSRGIFVMQAPFIYPIHDTPLDFKRCSIHGMREFAATHGFKIAEEIFFGSSLETATLLTNIGPSMTAINCAGRWHPLALLVLLLPFLALLFNLLGLILSRSILVDGIMAAGYRLLPEKSGCRCILYESKYNCAF